MCAHNMTEKVNKHFLNNRHAITGITPCAMKLQQLTRPFNLSVHIQPPNDSVQSSCQLQTGNKTYCKPDQSQVSTTKHSRTHIAIGANKVHLSQKCTKAKTTERTNKVQIPTSRSQSQGRLTHTSSATVKQTQTPCVQRSASAVTSDALVPGAKEDQTADRHVKQKKSAKQKQDGASNWMKLCTTLNIDGTNRKTKPLKRAAANDGLEQGEHSQVKRAKPGIWFDNVDKILIEPEPSEHSGVDTGGSSSDKHTADPLVKPDSFKGVTNCVAMDCEMVGVGPSGEESILARVSIVNHFGVCLYDKYVQPREKVTDYRTYVSGVTAEHLAIGEDFTKVQSEVSDLIKDRILVGHAVHNDLKVLLLTHPHKMIRDTSLYKPFRDLFNGRLPSLKKLTDKVLGVRVQEGQHSSVQDAQATMRLYTMHRQKWEKQLRQDRKMGRSRQRQKKQVKPDSV